MDLPVCHSDMHLQSAIFGPQSTCMSCLDRDLLFVARVDRLESSLTMFELNRFMSIQREPKVQPTTVNSINMILLIVLVVYDWFLVSALFLCSV